MRRENKWSRREHEESRHFLQRFTQSLIQCDEYFGFWTLACGSSLASSSALKPRLLSFGPQMSLGIFFSFIWYLWNMFEEMSFKIPSRGLRTHARPLSLEFANFPRNDFWRKARGRLWEWEGGGVMLPFEFRLFGLFAFFLSFLPVFCLYCNCFPCVSRV